MPLRFDEIGKRLRAYRMGKNLTADKVAELIGVSRAAVYRLERGELVKIETLERLSELLDTSLPSLLGVGVEYYSNAVSFFERMRQIEEVASLVIGNFSPISWLLLSDQYVHYLRAMLIEGLPNTKSEHDASVQHIDRVLEVLGERRRAARVRKTAVVSIVGTQDVERLLRNGLIGRFDLPGSVIEERRALAREEVQRLIQLIELPPIGVQIGVLGEAPSTQTFQVFEGTDSVSVSLSPYRLGDLPNVSSGIAMVTSTPEAVRLFRETLAEQWGRSHKGESGAGLLRQLIQRTGG